ncbi:MAG: hypothetical protein J5997_13340 [Oscillospiraceae bacterium]|nr:hypothetical protein [Oscillospiraceae bacterium]
MEHDVNLNIHYSAPEEVWTKIDSVYRTMPYWSNKDDCSRWVGDDIDLLASVEPGGIQISGTMPDDIWDEWYDTLKNRLTEALGYEIGEPEEGYSFKFWEPFEKNYSDIKSIDNRKIVFNDNSVFYWEEFEHFERDITAKPSFFLFRSRNIELRICFDATGLSAKRENKKNFINFQNKLKDIGIRTLDLS